MGLTPIIFQDNASHVNYPMTDGTQIDAAIKSGWIPLRPDGVTPMKVQSFEGGWLLDGAPLNVWLGEGWYSGQQQLLIPYWRSGEIPTPPANILGVTVVPIPATEAAKFNAYQIAQQNILGVPWYLWAAGAAVYLLMR